MTERYGCALAHSGIRCFTASPVSISVRGLRTCTESPCASRSSNRFLEHGGGPPLHAVKEIGGLLEPDQPVSAVRARPEHKVVAFQSVKSLVYMLRWSDRGCRFREGGLAERLVEKLQEKRPSFAHQDLRSSALRRSDPAQAIAATSPGSLLQSRLPGPPDVCGPRICPFSTSFL